MRYRCEYPANRYVFKARLNCLESTGGSRRWSGSEFQTVRPAKENARVLLPVLLTKIDNRLLNCTDRHMPPSCTIISYTFTAAGATSRCVTWPDCRINNRHRPLAARMDFSARLTMSVCLSVRLFVCHTCDPRLLLKVLTYFIQW